MGDAENAELIADLRRQRKGIGEAIRNCRHVLLFIIFLSIFTALVLVEEFAQFYKMETSIRDLFDDYDEAQLKKISASNLM